MLRMEHSSFLFILRNVEEDITPKELTMGDNKVISPAERLTLTIRLLATGKSYKSLSFQFRVSERAISYVVQEVSSAIVKRLSALYFKVPSSTGEWLQIARAFEERWSYPHALGAIDGKHIVIQKPANCGSHYFNC